MNKLIIIIMAAILGFTACKKEEVKPAAPQELQASVIQDTVFIEPQSTLKLINPGPPSSLLQFTIANPTGLDVNQWSTLSYTVPQGMRLDSIYCMFERPGYANQYKDLYINVNGQNVITYAPYTTSMYYRWWKMLTYNVSAGKYFSVSAPKVGSQGGVIWHGVVIHLTEVPKKTLNGSK